MALLQDPRAGRCPVREFLDVLATDAAAVVAAMGEVASAGLAVSRHLRRNIYEVRADGNHQSYRLLFATEGRAGHVLLALEAFSKKTQKTPPAEIDLALSRLADWRTRARPMRPQ